MHDYAHNFDSTVTIKVDWRFLTLFEYFLYSINDSYIKLEFSNMHDINSSSPIIAEFKLKTEEDIEIFLKYFSCSHLRSTIKITIYNENFNENYITFYYNSSDCNNSKIQLKISTLNLMLVSIITKLTNKEANFLNKNYVSCDIKYELNYSNKTSTFHFSKYVTSTMPFILFSNNFDEVKNIENIYEYNLLFNYQNIFRIILIFNVDLHKDLRLAIEIEKNS